MADDPPLLAEKARVRAVVYANSPPLLRRRLERIKARATAERLVKGRAEMAQTVVADFQGRFGDVEITGPEQFFSMRNWRRYCVMVWPVCAEKMRLK